MNTTQEIERQEQELKELLQRVMQEPLNPITGSVQELDGRLDQMEQMVRDLREVELAALSLGAEDSRKQLRSLKTITEDTPREIHSKLQPLLEQSVTSLTQGQQNILTALGELRDLRELLHLREQLEQATQQYANLQNETLKTQLEQQTEQERQLLSRLQKNLMAHSEQQRQQSSDAAEQSVQPLKVQLQALVETVSTIKTSQVMQAERLTQVQQEQAQMPKLVANDLTQALSSQLQSVRVWLLTAVGVSAASLIGVVVLTARQFS